MTYVEELFSLRGRCAIVTGGYGHLGRAMCWALAAAGARVYCAGPSRERFYESFPIEILEALAGEHPEFGMADIRYLPFDLATAASHREALRQVGEESGVLDILVNNAFYLSPCHREELEPGTAEEGIVVGIQEAAFRRDMDGLLNNTVAFSEAAHKLLALSTQGRLINIASMYGMIAPNPELYSEHPQHRSRASYNAAKAGLLQLTRYWASFWGTEQFTVNAISPGAFPRAEMAQRDRSSIQFSEKLKQQSILRRCGKPEDLAGALLLLSSRAGGYITGHNLVVDGGWTVR